MSAKIGDKVRFLNDVGSGVIVRIEKQIAFVSDEDGFERPSPLSQLVIIESIDSQLKKKTKIDVDTQNKTLTEATKYKPTIKFLNDNCIYLAINPLKKNILETDKIEVVLLNDSDKIVLFNLYKLVNEKASNLKAGFLEPDVRQSISELTLSGLDLTIGYQIIQYETSSSYTPTPIIQGVIRLKDIKLVKSNEFKPTPFFENEAMLIKLDKDLFETDSNWIDRIKDVKSKDIPVIKTELKTRNSVNDLLEIDLHIDQLRDDSKSLMPNEILPIQIEAFHKVMKENLHIKGKHIVFIHGVGSGKLKGELLRVLSKNYPKCQVQDASFQEYGFGATRVTIK